ncbi:tRNA (guanine(37)-N(1))-methyltransferase [hydrothermal vent metagenome]|uniref:tRNA (guanine-N(1)-)-methyltransferase n=1 Tax=hydrothermal vent metagenome TaxID=652676 RepID=A0A3B0RNM8_9ZZZZ
MKSPFSTTVLTLYPEAFPGVLGVSVIGRALAQKKWQLETLDIRSFSDMKHASVDDTTAGGGPGMVLRPDVAAMAIDSVTRDSRPLIHLSPRGKPLTQARVHELANGPGMVLFCSRFEGLDQRVIEARDMEEISIGDYVLAGGEVAAQVLIEACVRLIPGVLGALASIEEESFEQGLLEHPQYTRPRVWEEKQIPKVLLSGDHQRIARWRRDAATDLTKRVRPDLMDRLAKQESDDEHH